MLGRTLYIHSFEIDIHSSKQKYDYLGYFQFLILSYIHPPHQWLYIQPFQFLHSANENADDFPWYHSYEILILPRPPFLLSQVAGKLQRINRRETPTRRLDSIPFIPCHHMRKEFRFGSYTPTSFQVIEADTLKLEFVIRFSIHNCPLYTRRHSPSVFAPLILFFLSINTLHV